MFFFWFNLNFTKQINQDHQDIKNIPMDLDESGCPARGFLRGHKVFQEKLRALKLLRKMIKGMKFSRTFFTYP